MDSYDHFYFVIIFCTFTICSISKNINILITINFFSINNSALHYVFFLSHHVSV